MWWGSTHLSKMATNHSGHDSTTVTSDDHLTFLFCFEFFYITLLLEQHRNWVKMTLDPNYSVTANPVMNSLCDGSLLATRWTLSEQSHCRNVFFLERPLISSSFSPSFILSLRLYIIISLNTAAFCSPLLLYTHSCVSTHPPPPPHPPPREVKNLVWLLRNNLDFDHLVWLHRQGAWIIHESVHSLIYGDSTTHDLDFVLKYFFHFFFIFFLLSAYHFFVFAALQRDWDLHQRHKGDPVWQGRVLLHRLR